MGIALGTIHKGLHIARNVVVNGEFVGSETVIQSRVIMSTARGPVTATSLSLEWNVSPRFGVCVSVPSSSWACARQPTFIFADRAGQFSCTTN